MQTLKLPLEDPVYLRDIFYAYQLKQGEKELSSDKEMKQTFKAEQSENSIRSQDFELDALRKYRNKNLKEAFDDSLLASKSEFDLH